VEWLHDGGKRPSMSVRVSEKKHLRSEFLPSKRLCNVPSSNKLFLTILVVRVIQHWTSFIFKVDGAQNVEIKGFTLSGPFSSEAMKGPDTVAGIIVTNGG
jgi:hypothetical protein